MTYEEWRVAAVTAVYKETLEELVRKEYRKGQPTIVLLLGGMGSELRRMDMRYQGQSATSRKRSVNILGSDKNTVTSWTWKPLPEGYKSDDDSLLQERSWGPGEGTVPSWSAWHAGTPGNNVCDTGV